MSRIAKNKLSKSNKSRASPCQAMPGTAKQCLGKAKDRSCSCLGNKRSCKAKGRAHELIKMKSRDVVSGFPKTFHSPNCCKPDALDPRSFREQNNLEAHGNATSAARRFRFHCGYSSENFPHHCWVARADVEGLNARDQGG